MHCFPGWWIEVSPKIYPPHEELYLIVHTLPPRNRGGARYPPPPPPPPVPDLYTPMYSHSSGQMSKSNESLSRSRRRRRRKKERERLAPRWQTAAVVSIKYQVSMKCSDQTTGQTLQDAARTPAGRSAWIRRSGSLSFTFLLALRGGQPSTTDKQPWTPSRKRCRCSRSTKSPPSTEQGRPSRTGKMRRREAKRSAPIVWNLLLRAGGGRWHRAAWLLSRIHMCVFYRIKYNLGNCNIYVFVVVVFFIWTPWSW